MISPAEIKQACLKRWKDVLLQGMKEIAGMVPPGFRMLFPMEIPRIGKIQTKDILTNLSKYRREISSLHQQSKQVKGYGYSIYWEERVFEKIGANKVPEKIVIDSLDDYLRLTDKGLEYSTFTERTWLILSVLPQLSGWIEINPLRIIEHPYWPETLSVCRYFMENPHPQLYIRQLPVRVHTKFIKEENEGIFRSLLDYLLPDQISSPETRFEKRYHLRYAEPLIRIRFLDEALSPVAGITDISVPVSEFRKVECRALRVFVAENLMNFLTLPYVPGSIALWSGGGFNVSNLRDVSWLKPLQFFFWGDIDAHGFHILHQFRSYFPDTTAIMMDEETLNTFHSEDDKKGPSVCVLQLPGLSPHESKLYEYVCRNNIRLEQEKINQEYAEGKIRESMK